MWYIENEKPQYNWDVRLSVTFDPEVVKQVETHGISSTTAVE